MPAKVSPDELLDDIQRVAEAVSGVPSADDYRKHGDHGVSTLYRHFGDFETARAMAGVDGEVQTGVSDEELLADLRRVDDSLDKTVSSKDYQKHGNHSTGTLHKRFGGFPDAREAAGIDGDPSTEPRLSDEELLNDVRRVYEEIGEPPSEEQYKQHGDHGYQTLRKRFGSIRQIREAAGVPNPDRRGGNNRIPEQELLDAIHEMADDLGRPPKRDEMLDDGPFSEGPYRRRYGSWNDALREAGYEPVHVHNKERLEYECEVCGTVGKRLASRIPNGQQYYYCSNDCKYEHYEQRYSGEGNPSYDGGKQTVECAYCGEELKKKPSVVERKENLFCGMDCFSGWCSENRVEEEHPRWKGGGDLYYGPNWQRQRRRRLERDDYECQRCGMSNDEHHEELGRDLGVHHTTPVRMFYERADDEPDWDAVNDLDNLVTLCIGCHRKVETRESDSFRRN